MLAQAWRPASLRSAVVMTHVMHRRPAGLGLLLLICLTAAAQTPAVSPPLEAEGPLTAEEVVERMVHRNLDRAQALHRYQGTRLYRLQYRGFGGARDGEMVVEMKYDRLGTKEFTEQSAAGSKLLLKVFRKLLQSEKEALAAEHQERTALNQDNYRFTLLAMEDASTGPAYVLAVEPRQKSKFVYRGRIWVDAQDFAVVRVEAEPAKNPSFWTKKTQITHLYVKVGDFWLPQHNSSVSNIRFGGRAELTIEYRDYQITASGPLTAPANTLSRRR